MGQIAAVKFETVFLNENPPTDDRIGQLVYWCKRFDKLGLAPKSAGNLSIRVKKGFIITATGVALKDVARDNLTEVLRVEIEPARIVVYVKGKLIPSKESVLHSEIYHLRSEINAVFHIHDQLVVELADELNLPCTQGEQPRGSYELVKEVNRLLGLTRDAKYLVLEKHGVVAMGETLEEAGRLVEDMNNMARNKAQRR